MIALGETAAVLLCAGLSTRFGAGNKLLEPLHGKPLVAHAADMLATAGLRACIAVTGQDTLDGLPAPFVTVRNPVPAHGQDSSMRIGIAAALGLRPRAILLCLADMPCVTITHLTALAMAADDQTAAISWSGAWRSPPAVLPVGMAETFLRGDCALRDMLARAPVIEVATSPEMLRDFDTPADFTAGMPPP